MKKIDTKKTSLKVAEMLKDVSAKDLETTAGAGKLNPCYTCGLIGKITLS